MGNPSAWALAAAVLGLAGAGLGIVLLQILRQQGRLLLRLEEVEKHLGLASAESIARGTVALQARSRDGLPVGTALPDFHLPDLDGRMVSLTDFRERRVLLVHWSARCGFCDLIAPDLARLGPELEKLGIEVLFVSAGPERAEREAAKEHGLPGRILIQKETDRLPAFAQLGTPSAYLLDAESRVARPLAIGADQVLALVEELAPRTSERKRLPGDRPLSESRIQRNGLKAGTSAPAFTLPDLQGGTFSLAEHQGKKVLLVFSDPHCAPCDALAPHLASLHERHRGNGLEVVMVGRGDPEENRRKAERHGFEFPVVMQKKWELSRRYGIFETPVGFLIDEEGVIERDVARGIDAILSLVPAAPRCGKAVAHDRVA